MSVRVNVKPLTHWLIYRHYTVRFTERTINQVSGILTTPNGPLPFRYDPNAFVVHLPTKTVHINEFGWEIDPPSTES
jgi:hypothetical protein